MKLSLSTEEMGIDVMSSGHHLLLLAVIVCEMTLIRFVIYRVPLVKLASLTVMFDN